MRRAACPMSRSSRTTFRPPSTRRNSNSAPSRGMGSSGCRSSSNHELGSQLMLPGCRGDRGGEAGQHRNEIGLLGGCAPAPDAFPLAPRTRRRQFSFRRGQPYRELRIEPVGEESCQLLTIEEVDQEPLLRTFEVADGVPEAGLRLNNVVSVLQFGLSSVDSDGDDPAGSKQLLSSGDVCVRRCPSPC